MSEHLDDSIPFDDSGPKVDVAAAKAELRLEIGNCVAAMIDDDIGPDDGIGRQVAPYQSLSVSRVRRLLSGINMPVGMLEVRAQAGFEFGSDFVLPAASARL